MFSEAISSILSCWRFISPPIAAAISGSADARSSCQKRCIEGGAGTGAVFIGQEYSAAGVGKLVDPALMPAFKEIGRHEGFEAGDGHFDADQTRAHGDDIGVVVRTGEGGGKRLGDRKSRRLNYSN